MSLPSGAAVSRRGAAGRARGTPRLGVSIQEQRRQHGGEVMVQQSAIVGLWVGITQGISAGDRVIIRGAERLQPGQAVETIESVSVR